MPARIEFAPGLVIQGFTPPLRLRDFKLIAFDMDSTLINIAVSYTHLTLPTSDLV